jgi:hypothetical protein
VQGPSKTRSAIKFAFWTAAAAGMFCLVAYSYVSGQMTSWFYYSAAKDGYAVDADSFRDASPAKPAFLEIGGFEQLKGLQAVRVKKGDRLPIGANGIVVDEIVTAGKRVVLEGTRLKVTIPWEIQQAKGFKYKDTFKHKGIRTFPWAALWNVFVVIGLGICLGFMAEGFTDLIGIKLEKIRHFEGH